MCFCRRNTRTKCANQDLNYSIFVSIFLFGRWWFSRIFCRWNLTDQKDASVRTAECRLMGLKTLIFLFSRKLSGHKHWGVDWAIYVNPSTLFQRNEKKDAFLLLPFVNYTAQKSSRTTPYKRETLNTVFFSHPMSAFKAHVRKKHGCRSYF